MTLISKVITLAVEAHDGQTDKVGDPYIFHPLRVMMDCNTLTEKIVAVLHDIVEDTDITFEDIRALFSSDQTLGRTVVDAVDAMTKRDGEKYEDYLLRVKQNPIALSVKLSDIQDNISPKRQERLSIENRTMLQKKYEKALLFLQ